ncbi:hypothetical protein J6590_068232 [Homalodisca vitripennis]|nr:hypothetical protein J6590_068232 [Homalodisca vitripennis]
MPTMGGRPTEENMEILNESMAHLVELNAINRISKGLSNQKWRFVLGTHCEVHYALPFLTGSSYSDAKTTPLSSNQPRPAREPITVDISNSWRGQTNKIMSTYRV